MSCVPPGKGHSARYRRPEWVLQETERGAPRCQLTCAHESETASTSHVSGDTCSMACSCGEPATTRMNVGAGPQDPSRLRVQHPMDSPRHLPSCGQGVGRRGSVPVFSTVPAPLAWGRGGTAQLLESNSPGGGRGSALRLATTKALSSLWILFPLCFGNCHMQNLTCLSLN